MDLLPQIATALAFFAANILSPGPNVFNTIAIALGSGRTAALAVVPAIALGVGGWAAAAILGAGSLFRAYPGLEPALTALGGLLLLWFAARYFRQAWHWQATVGRQTISPRAAFVRTLAVLATNPKALTTWLVLISIFPAGQADAAAVALMILGAMLVASLGHLGYALAFSTPAAARAYGAAGRWIVAGVGLAFTALGGSLLAEALG